MNDDEKCLEGEKKGGNNLDIYRVGIEAWGTRKETRLIPSSLTLTPVLFFFYFKMFGCFLVMYGFNKVHIVQLTQLKS